MKILCIILLLTFQSEWEIANKSSPLLLKENIQLKNYNISKSFRLNENEYILIGQDEIFNIDTEGLRLIYLLKDEKTSRYPIRFVSENKGEAYVYNPYVFEFKDGKRLLIAEEGFEYMSGIDIFLFDKSEIRFIGYIPVSGVNRDSVINNLIVEKKGEEFRLRFNRKVEYEVSTDNIIDGKRLTCHISNGNLTINLK